MPDEDIKPPKPADEVIAPPEPAPDDEEEEIIFPDDDITPPLPPRPTPPAAPVPPSPAPPAGAGGKLLGFTCSCGQRIVLEGKDEMGERIVEGLESRILEHQSRGHTVERIVKQGG